MSNVHLKMIYHKKRLGKYDWITKLKPGESVLHEMPGSTDRERQRYRLNAMGALGKQGFNGTIITSKVLEEGVRFTRRCN